MRIWVPTFVLVLFYLQLIAVSADCNPSSGTITINNENDASAVATCTSLTGDLVIATNAPTHITLDGIQSVSGKLVVENVVALESLSASTLQSVQSFSLNNLPKLSNLSFPGLRNFSSIYWNNLPALNDSTFGTAAHDGEIKEIAITNTSLQSLDWLTWPVGSTLNISDNAELRSFQLRYSSINAGSALTFDSNPSLENISFPSLGSVNGAFQISNCGAIKTLAFDKLESIGGYMQLTGAFTGISMPALNNINGGLSIQSTGDVQSFCTELQNKTASGIISGHYNCKANAQGNPSANSTSTATATASSKPTSSDPANSSPGSSGVSKGMQIGLGVGFGVATIFAVAFAVLFFKYRANKKKPVDHPDSDEEGLKAIELENASPPSEMDSQRSPSEMPSGRLTQELPGTEGHKEMGAEHGISELETPTTPSSRVFYEMPA